MIDEIRNCVFYDKNGKEIIRFDKLSNVSITHSIETGSIPIIDCNFSAYQGGLIGTYEGKEVKVLHDELNDKYEKYKVMYNGDSSM